MTMTILTNALQTGIAGSGCASDPHALSRAIIDGYLEVDARMRAQAGVRALNYDAQRLSCDRMAVVRPGMVVWVGLLGVGRPPSPCNWQQR